MSEDHLNEKGRRVFSAEEARQGEIVLKQPWQRGAFIAGLAGLVLVVLIFTGWLMSH